MDVRNKRVRSSWPPPLFPCLKYEISLAEYGKVILSHMAEPKPTAGTSVGSSSVPASRSLLAWEVASVSSRGPPTLHFCASGVQCLEKKKIARNITQVCR